MNELLDAKTLDRLHTSVVRNRPFGDDQWTARVAKKHGLESRLRAPWRPRKPQGENTGKGNVNGSMAKTLGWPPYGFHPLLGFKLVIDLTNVIRMGIVMQIIPRGRVKTY